MDILAIVSVKKRFNAQRKKEREEECSLYLYDSYEVSKLSASEPLVYLHIGYTQQFVVRLRDSYELGSRKMTRIGIEAYLY